MPGNKKSSTAKAKSERRAVKQAAKQHKLTSGSGDLILQPGAVKDKALRAGGQEPTIATRKRALSASGGKHKRKQKLSKGSFLSSQGTKTHKRVKGKAA